MSKIKADRLDTWSIYIVKTYNYFREDSNKITSIGQVPIEALNYLSAFTYLELITPFVNKDLQKGISRDRLEIKYRVTESEARSLGRKLGYYKKITTK